MDELQLVGSFLISSGCERAVGENSVFACSWKGRESVQLNVFFVRTKSHEFRLKYRPKL